MDLVAHSRFCVVFGGRQEVRKDMEHRVSVRLDPYFVSSAATCVCLILTTKSGCCKDFEGSSNPHPSLWEDLPPALQSRGAYPASKDLREVSQCSKASSPASVPLGLLNLHWLYPL